MLKCLLVFAILGQEPVEPEKAHEAPGKGEIPLSELIDVIGKFSKKELLSTTLQQLLQKPVPTAFLKTEGLTPEEAFDKLGIILVANGLGLIRDAKTDNRYYIVLLLAPFPLTPSEYQDPQKLPTGEEICALTLKLRNIRPQAAYELIQGRLHPALLRLSIKTPGTLSLVDFAPTLRHVARLIADADQTTTRAMRPIDLDFWLVQHAQKSEPSPASNEVKELLPCLKSRLPIDEKTELDFLGHGSVRVTPSGPDAQTSIMIPLTERPPRYEIGGDVGFDRSLINLKMVSFRAVREVREGGVLFIFRSSDVRLTPSEYTVLTMWDDKVLVARATIRESHAPRLPPMLDGVRGLRGVPWPLSTLSPRVGRGRAQRS